MLLSIRTLRVALSLLSALAAALQVDPPPAFPSREAAFAAGLSAVDSDAPRRAVACFEACLELARPDPVAAFHLACVRARLGDEGGALEALERAVEDGYDDAAVARFDPDLAGLRELPTYRALVAAMRGRASAFDHATKPASGSPIHWVGSTREEPTDATGRQRVVAPLFIECHAHEPRALCTFMDGQTAVLDLSTGMSIRRWGAPPSARERDRPWLPVSRYAAGGELVLRAGDRDTVSLAWRPDDADEPLHLVPLHGSGGPCRWFRAVSSPASDLVMFVPSEGACIPTIWSLHEQRLVSTLTPCGPEPGVCAVAWSADGDLVAVGMRSGRVLVMSAESGEQVLAPLVHTEKPFVLAFSPDSAWLAVGGDEDLLRIWSLDAALLPADLRPGYFMSHCTNDLVWAPDGTRLLSGSQSGYVTSWSVPNFQRQWELDFMGGNDSGCPVEFDCDGRRVLVTGASRGQSCIVSSEDGERLVDLSRLDGRSLDWDSDAQLVIGTAGDELRVVDVATGRDVYRRVQGEDGRSLLLAPSLHYAGDVELTASGNVTIEGETYPLDCFSHLLHDPRRVRAAAARDVPQRLVLEPGGPVDPIPFGPLQAGTEIAWPPKGEPRMNVLGLEEALRSAEELSLPDGLDVRIPTVECLLASKILAREDRKHDGHDKDADDIAQPIESADQLFDLDDLDPRDESLLELAESDPGRASCLRLGDRLRMVLEPRTRQRLLEILRADRSEPEGPPPPALLRRSQRVPDGPRRFAAFVQGRRMQTLPTDRRAGRRWNRRGLR